MTLIWVIILLVGVYSLIVDYKEAPIYIKPIIVFHVFLLLFLMIMARLI